MKHRLPALALVLAAVAGCTGEAAVTTTTLGETTTTTVAEATTTTTAPEVRICPAPPYEIGFLPLGVGAEDFDPSQVEPDVWTSVGGSNSMLLGRDDGTVAVALIRGTLPAIDWPGDKGIVQIDGVDAAVGPHDDGTWVAGWYVEPAERCDLYTMVFYPPWNPRDVEAVLLSMTRTAG
jgi:hypothetical protein